MEELGRHLQDLNLRSLTCTTCRANIFDPTVLAALEAVRGEIPSLRERLVSAASGYEKWLTTEAIELFIEYAGLKEQASETPVHVWRRYRYL